MSAAALGLARGDWPVPADAWAGTGELDFDIPRLTKVPLHAQPYSLHPLYNSQHDTLNQPCCILGIQPSTLNSLP
jgi:hypothetical protein